MSLPPVSALAIGKWFDLGYYRAQIDSEPAGSVVEDYFTSGWRAGLDPSPHFSSNGYLDDHPDVAASGLNPLHHFLVWGQHEGRSVRPSRRTLGSSANLNVSRSVGLVTSELPGLGASGGIGAAAEEAAFLVAESGTTAELFFVAHEIPSAAALRSAQGRLAARGVALHLIDWRKYVTHPSHELMAFAVYRYLRQLDGRFRALTFADYGGLGYFCVQAKKQGIAFNAARIIGQIHGPTRWALERNGEPFTEPSQLVRDFMEREFVVACDAVVAPSQYIANWCQTAWGLSELDYDVIRNVVAAEVVEDDAVAETGAVDLSCASERPSRDVVLLGRHETRKGLETFCRALDRLNDELTNRGSRVVFLGSFAQLAGETSGEFLERTSKDWRFSWEVTAGSSRHEVAALLRSLNDPVVVVASVEENCPYAVLEPASMGLQTVFSERGGAKESFTADSICGLTFLGGDPITLAAAVRFAFTNAGRRPLFADSHESIERRWLSMLTRTVEEDSKTSHESDQLLEPPLVTVGITHFNRPAKAVEAVDSILRQNYSGPIEILMCDDGSRPEILDQLTKLLANRPITLITRENGYLGAARNSILRAASGRYTVFLDDDDIALPQMVSSLVGSAVNANLDAVAATPLYMPETSRQSFAKLGMLPDARIGHIFLGGPIAAAPWMNTLAGAVTLFRTDLLRGLGGYTEVYGVGYEDFELAARWLLAGYTLGVHPDPLFLYETGTSSMATSTSLTRGSARVMSHIGADADRATLADVANLSGGIVAHQEMLRRRAVRSGSTAETTRHKLAIEGLSDAEVLERHTEWCVNVGARRLLGALSAGAARRATCGQGRGSKRTLRTLEEVWWSDDQESRANFKAFISRGSWDLEPGDLEALAAMDWSRLVDESTFVDFACRLVQASRDVPREVSIAVRTSIGLLANTLSLDEELGCALVEVQKLEEEQYLATYPDVRGGIPDWFATGFEHYVEAGQGEGRVGFSSTRLLAMALLGTGDAPSTESLGLSEEDLSAMRELVRRDAVNVVDTKERLWRGGRA